MLIKSKVARVEQSMTPFWKEERWGYNIYQNEKQQFFWPRPSIPLTRRQGGGPDRKKQLNLILKKNYPGIQRF